jgi:RNA polymerase sigma-70 factor (ECF subfamily)
MAEIDELYRSQAGVLLAYLRRSFGWCAAPEDLLQETFLHALRHRDRLAAATSQRAWLFGVARHVGLTWARRHQPGQRVDQGHMPAAAENPQLPAMREAIEQLPELLRETLQLRLAGGLSYEEIAQVLEIPIGTVRSRLHTAMRQLKEALIDEPDSE